MIETATDNPVRTVANMRMYFNKYEGNLGGAGSVGYGFQRMGVLRLDPTGLDSDELELELIDAGLQEIGLGQSDKGEAQLVIRCAFADLGELQAAVEARGLAPISVESEYIPTNTVELPEEQATEVLALIDKLEQDDDVQKVFHNLG